ncbi:MOSC domain-containing protein [Streptomyces sp. A7024]|uniref:MOSC domain-containing protein n=1 Tax=Streptomyces coryli TaxID=1128680 RepID=A0A6G4TZT5_9ACTN|nr:MOSC N-terminal beta barrel domain-containing protein [Streptomyces coryli]NGN64501.1 MOSC domain-containing protein [Streptomyces coryli]
MTDLAELARLVRYPVKGMPGQDLAGARVRAGGGVPHDRTVALVAGRGQEHLPRCGQWAPTKTFLNLTSTPELLRCRVDLVEETGVLRLGHPERESLAIPLDRPGVLATIDWFAGAGEAPATLVRAADGGYWDDPDGTVSLINLATVDALADAVGTPVDPLRFRGNLYLSGLPAWAELGLVGERIAIGDVELEVLHPINRCRATAVNPADARRDLPVPAELNARFGHVFCGLRARVVMGGTLTVGAALSRTGDTITPVPTDGGPPPARWPRPARIAARSAQPPDAIALWLDDPLHGLRPAPQPGQQLRVHAADGAGPLWRSYPIGDHDGPRLQITVPSAGPGDRLATLLHADATPGEELIISGPYGRA